MNTTHTNRIQEFDTVLPPQARAEFFRFAPKTTPEPANYDYLAPYRVLVKRSPEPERPRQPWHIYFAIALFVIAGALACHMVMTGTKNAKQPDKHPDWVTSPGWPSGAPRAERVDAPWVHMPYGENLKINLRAAWDGVLMTQDQLPRTGNHIGDAFMIGKNLFVWVAPGGVGQWIDP
jgi:hypothetical protein